MAKLWQPLAHNRTYPPNPRQLFAYPVSTMRLASVVRLTTVISAALCLGLSGQQAAAQQQPRVDVPATESSDPNCGWALGGAAAIMAGTAYLGNQPNATGNWSGFYVGGHLGCTWSNPTVTAGNNSHFGATGDALGFTNDGYAVGGQLGYNFQFGRVVAGIEGTFSGGESHDEVAGLSPFNPAGRAYLLTSELRNIATVTARLGYVFDARWMGYVKGGFASATYEVSGFVTNGATATSVGSASRYNGYALGGGLEYMVSKNLTVGLDYSYLKLEDKDLSFACAPTACVGGGQSVLLNADPDDVHMVTGRVNFRLN